MPESNDFILYPVAGKTVRDPITGKPLKDGGEPKPRTAYWLRRVREQSVTTEPPAKASKAAAPVKADAPATPTKSDAK